MTPIMIPAEVVNGHLQHERSLPELEGQSVIATLQLSADNVNNGADEKSPSQKLIADFDSDLSLGSKVEHDFYFPMTSPSISIGKVTVKVEQGIPRIILPAELQDE